MQILMLIKDFIKLSSWDFPNDSFVKRPTKKIFKTRIINKKGKEKLTRNNGTKIDENEVAIIHEKIINFKFVGCTD